MDAETVEALVVFGKTALVIGAGCAITLGTIWVLCATGIMYCQRKDRRNELLLLYEEGKLTTKPTIRNAKKILAEMETPQRPSAASDTADALSTLASLQTPPDHQASPRG